MHKHFNIHIFKELHKVNIEYAQMYLNAFQCLKKLNDFAGMISSAHFFRELLEKLRRELTGSNNSEYNLKTKVYELKKSWPKLNIPQFNLSALDNLDNKQKKALINYLSNLIDNLDAKQKKALIIYLLNSISFFAEFNIHKTQKKDLIKNTFIQLNSNNLKLPEIIKNDWVSKWDACENYFQGIAHHHKRKNIDKDEFIANIKKLNDILQDTVINVILDKLTILDKLIKGTNKSNIEKNMKEIIRYLTNYSLYAYFYKQIKEPYWFEPLNKLKLFSPDNITREAMNYLITVAPSMNYKDLVTTCKSIAKTTNDPVIQNNILQVFLLIPPKYSTVIYPFIQKWLNKNNGFHGLFPKYISHLILGNYSNEAFSLAKDKFSLYPETKDPRSITVHGHTLSWPINLVSIYDKYNYKEYLNETLIELNKVDSYKTLFTLLSILDDSIKYLEVFDKNNTTYIRKTVESHPQNRDTYIDILVDIIRDFCVEHYSIKILKTIDSQKGHLFKRISIYLRNKHIDIDIKGTNKLLSDINIYEDTNYHHELFHILEDNFDKLSPKAQQTYFKYINKNIDIEIIKSYFDKNATEEQINKFINSEKYKKLWPIRHFLIGQNKKLFLKLAKSYGELKHPDINNYIESVQNNRNSGIKINNLNNTPIEEIIKIINKPLRYPMERETNDGTSFYWGEIVKSNPKEISNKADKFKIIEPTHIEALISSCTDYLKISSFERYDKFFELLKWVVDQPRAIPNHDGPYKDLNPGWVWTRRSIANFISELLKIHPKDVKLEDREVIWNIIKPLTEDPDPLEENNDQEPATLSINTVRGYAFHAMIQYAIWLNQTHGIKGGLDAIPEVKNILESHLDTDKETALSIRSVYGQWYPWIVEIDKKWAATSKSKIFPLDEENSAYFDAAWITYITFNKPYKPCFKILTNEYNHAIGLIGNYSDNNRYLKNPDNALAEHLIFYYTWGLIDLNNENNLINYFFNKSTSKLRGELIHHIGWVLFKFKENINEQVKKRLKDLWVWFKEQPRIVSEDYDDLQYIGWWILSDNFDPQWCLEQILYALDKCNKIEPEKKVTERIFDLAERYPLSAIKYLITISENEKYNWVLRTNKQIIENLINEHFNQSEYIDETKSLINKLIQNDVYFFGDLVNLIPDKYRES